MRGWSVDLLFATMDTVLTFIKRERANDTDNTYDTDDTDDTYVTDDTDDTDDKNDTSWYRLK